MASTSTASRHFGHIIKEHTVEVPWDPFTEAANAATFELFAREIYAPGNEDAPAIVYLQGGPGFPAPRPVGASGVIGEALKEFRVILLDQRGTGRSHRIDAANIADIPAERLAQLRQEYIVEDAEALRKHLGIAKWSLYGQSFGGFCITSYLSRYPEFVEHAYLTGGLPVLDRGADDLYRTTYAKLRTRHERFYREYPWAENRIREICAHLEQSAETLPTGERLSSRRFRTIGIELGRGDGFHNLAYLLEEPFHIRNGEKQLRTDFLADVGTRVSFADGPLYAAIHESIYGGVGNQPTTNWAAHRIREEIPGFEEKANPAGDEPFYLTGEHVFPWQFDEDPALVPFKEKAEAFAQHTWESSPYDSARLLADAPTSAAAVYLDDIFVPFEYSMETANCYRDLRPHVTNAFQHDGIRHDGAAIFARLRELVEDH
ncbi:MULTISPECIES: alpha/beta fold hydrolase [Corynebacterium]|uniref:alpha/beta fold hydrolase n=1 Tax=Corynebacterium TaxID=1716 RepID=UPI001CCE0A38|nr:alpha/beta fold hydrolase [Corynebacterium amycolatum]MCA0443998.1 alpha/beta hydrolase [Corynebacterium amycolatum]